MSAPEKKVLRCAFYARYSTDGQSVESVADQFRVCERLARQEHFESVARYEDRGISGGTAQRPGYQAMLDAARLHQFDVVVAEDLKRLWREQAEQWRAIKELIDLKIAIVTASGIDSRQQNFAVLAAVMGAAAEVDRIEAGYRTRRGLEGNAVRGEAAGGRSYGYEPAVDAEGNATRIIVREEAEIIKEIFATRAEGKSAVTICRRLNDRGVPPPGARWNRTHKGKDRKNPVGDWLPSAVAGDPTRGTGILNNELYVGRQVWGRSKWTGGAADSAKRTVTLVDESEWVITEHPELRIIDDDLWKKVRAIQLSTDPRREAVRRGIAASKLRGKKTYVSGRRRPYWLGSILVCPCGANYCGHGALDYACPTYTSSPNKGCSNNLRFRRDAVHEGVFALISEHVLSDSAVTQGTATVKAWLEAQAAAEEDAMREGVQSAEIRRLDEEAAALSGMNLRPAAIAAGLAAIEKERAELLARARGNRGASGNRAQRLLSRLPEIVSEYRKLVRNGIKSLASVEAVEAARQATRELLVDGQIVLTPSADGTQIGGDVRFLELGEHVLTLAGLPRRMEGNAHKIAGSGGRI